VDGLRAAAAGWQSKQRTFVFFLPPLSMVQSVFSKVPASQQQQVFYVLYQQQRHGHHPPLSAHCYHSSSTTPFSEPTLLISLWSVREAERTACFRPVDMINVG